MSAEEPHEVIPGLFISDYTTSQNADLLRSKGISNVVAASQSTRCPPSRAVY